MKLLHIKTLVLLLGLSFFGYGQEDSGLNLPDIVPPTPEVAALGKYIETPVSEFTGIPKIQIPIYSIDQGNIKHDIGLSYHAQGVKVEEIASRVGMGWNLNAGGVIHRQKRKLPDNAQYGYLRGSETVEELSDALNVENPYTCEAQEYFSTLFFPQSETFKKDFEPDVFSYSFGGYSGRFYFDQETKKPILEEASPLKIEWIDYQYNSENATYQQNNNYFKLTTPDGLEYYFGVNRSKNDYAKIYKGGSDIEDVWSTGIYGSSVDETDSPLYERYVATWYLMEIYSPINKSSVTFEYDVFDLGRVYRRLSSSVISKDYSYLQRSEISFKEQLSNQYEREYVLRKINFDNGSVEFISETEEDRKDLSGAYELNQIEVKGVNDQLIKYYGFDYFYANSGGEEDKNYRLFLDQLNDYEINKLTNTIKIESAKTYNFDYSNPNRLPDRFSTAQDFWGFHNGENSNENLLPNDAKYFQGELYQLGSANRQVNEDYSQDGALTKITYPTKGTIEYIYENNRAKKDIPIQSFCESRHSVMDNSWEEVFIHYRNSTTNVEHIESDDSPQYIMYFEIDDITSNSTGNNNQNIEIDYRNYDNNPDLKWIINLQKKDDQTSWGNNPDSGVNISEGINKIEVEPGEYRILMYWDSDEGDQYEYFDANDNWEIFLSFFKGTELSNLDYYVTGGLRVKEILTNDLQGNINTTKYVYEDENGETTGNLVSLPYRLTNLWYYADGESSPQGQRSAHFHEYSAESLVPLATTQGSYTGYSKVTKIYGNENNGKEEFFFSFERDHCNFWMSIKNNPEIGGDEYWAAANTPLLNEELQRGKLLSKISFNSEGETIQKTENSYDLNSYHEQQAYAIRSWGELWGGITECIQIAHIINEYTLESRSNLLHEQISTTYDSNGENPIETTTTYKYENSTFPTLQTGSTTVNSKGEVIETKTYYPDDIDGVNSLTSGPLSQEQYNAIERLQYNGEEYRVGQPIQQETKVNDVLTSVKRTNFNTDDNVTLPFSVHTALGDEDLEERLIYHSYTENGNPKEVSKTDGSHSIYIWGYNEQYPIAKIENATYENMPASVVTLIENIKTKSNDENSVTEETELTDLFEGLRTNAYFANSMLTTYTYDPLVGVTSITDPKGYTTYYEYDGFQRLLAVRDAEGNLLSTNEYNYKN